MKIIILGSQGFIGTNLVNFFLKKKYEITGCDIVEYSTLEYNYIKLSILSPDFETVFKDNTFEFCINASGSGSVAFSIKQPLSDFELNVVSVTKVLDILSRYQPGCKYVHISSAAVYGNPKELPIKEADDLKPLSPYGFHKLISEQICREYYELFGIPVAIIRPFSVYGAGLRKQLFWDICRKIYLANNKLISLYGTGNESRDFIYIEDLVKLIEIILKESSFNYDIYNAASGIETTIAAIASEIEKGFPEIKIDFSGEKREGDPINWCADVRKINELGFLPSVTIKEGTKKYLDWFTKENHDDK